MAKQFDASGAIIETPDPTLPELELMPGLVAVIPVKPEEATRSGIIVPEVAQERPPIADVVAVGPARATATATGFATHARHVRAGDRVLHRKYSGHQFTLNGIDFLVLDEHEIVAVLPPPTQESSDAPAGSDERSVH